MKRTPLYEAHVAAGATMVDFGGWEMPIEYPTGIISEHLYDRRYCGIFDVSHMGRLWIEGPQRLAFLQRVLTSNAAALIPGRAQYCIIPDEHGFAVDDAYLYMFDDRGYLLVVNAANTDKDLQHLSGYLAEYDCTLTNITDQYSSIAVQGPQSAAILEALSGAVGLAEMKKNDLGVLTIQGRTVRFSRTGYTGDPIGFELFIHSDQVRWLWDQLIGQGARPTGLGARDTLRLEAGLPLYGHEMGLDQDGAGMPVFAVPLARFAVSFAPEKGDFVGKAALLAQKTDGTAKKIFSIALRDRGVIRAGMPVYQGDRPIGYVTSGTMVPYYCFDSQGQILDTTGKRSIGLAYLDADAQGDVHVAVRGKRLSAALVGRHMIQSVPPYGKAVIL